jgi:hypothetical protein
MATGRTASATTLQNDLCPQALQRWCAEEKREFFSFTSCFCFFIILFFFFFFFKSYYKGYSLHDYKLKNTQECIAQMLTLKPMYKESKCMWGCITWCRFPKLRSSQVVVCFWCPFSLSYVVASYGCYCSCCNYNIRVEKEKEVATIQEHKKPTSKRNPRNSKAGKIYCFQH